MKHGLALVVSLWLLCYVNMVMADKQSSSSQALQCAAFSPYVGDINPHYGAHPSKALINELLDTLIKQTPFRCIMTYGVLNGLDATFAAAKARHLKVIAILWLDDNPEVNSLSINKGIEVAKAYPQTIIKLSCGSEVRTRHGYRFDGEISRCIDALRKAGVSQPITTIDTWWEWCNRSLTCAPTNFGTQVDWIGVNVFPWWENLYSTLHPCTPAEKAADFHIARLEELHKTYADKDIILTEFGWPNGPEGSDGGPSKTGQRCGIANSKNQKQVIQATFKQLAKKHWSGIAFEAFAETWKPSKEGDSGSFWGVCSGLAPYRCLQGLTLK